MTESATVALTAEGSLSLPDDWREAHNLRPGDPVTVLSVGDILVVSPGASRADSLADAIAHDLAATGETEGTLNRAVRDIRERQ